MDLPGLLDLIGGGPGVGLTEYGQQYQPNAGTQGLNAAAGRMLVGAIPMVAPSGTDMEAMRRQLEAQMAAGQYFGQQPRNIGPFGGGDGGMMLPSMQDDLAARQQAFNRPSFVQSLMHSLNPGVQNVNEARVQGIKQRNQRPSILDLFDQGVTDAGTAAANWWNGIRDNGRSNGPSGGGGLF